MNRFTVVALLALATVTSFVVGDLLNPDPVPVAEAVELSGVAPDPGPPAEGFFVVPPRVVDLRNQDDDDSDDTGFASTSQGDDDAGEPDDDRDDIDDSDDDFDDGPDESDDDLDDEDDSVDHDD